MQNTKPRSAASTLLALITLMFGWLVLMFFSDQYDPPASDQLTRFIGKVDSITQHGKNYRLQIAASNQNDKIAVTIPAIWDARIQEKLQLGQTVEIGYFRQNFMSDIDVWHITSGQQPIVSYQEFVANQPQSPLHKYLVALYEKFL